MQPILLGLRVAILVLSIIVLGLLAYLVWATSQVREYDYYYGYYYTRINIPGFDFTLFTAVWTILASIYYIMAAVEKPLPKAATHPGAILGLDILTNIFWLAAWAVNASYASAAGCTGSDTVCAILIAAIVFAVVNWLLLTGTTVLSGLTLGGKSFGGFKKRSNDVEFTATSTPATAIPTHTPVTAQSPVSQMTQPATHSHTEPSAVSAPSAYSGATATTQPLSAAPVSQEPTSSVPAAPVAQPTTQTTSAVPHSNANELNAHPDAREMEANSHGYYGNR